VEPVRGLLVFAAARFFLEPRFCEPWAALVVNAYPIFWQWFNWYRYPGSYNPVVNHSPKMLAFNRPNGVSVMYNASATLHTKSFARSDKAW